MDMLITLCVDCHKAVHERKKEIIHLQNILKYILNECDYWEESGEYAADLKVLAERNKTSINYIRSLFNKLNNGNIITINSSVEKTLIFFLEI